MIFKDLIRRLFIISLFLMMARGGVFISAAEIFADSEPKKVSVFQTDPRVVPWGDNSYGQCDVPSSNVGYVAVSAGFDHCLGLRSDGSIAAWGNNDDGQCDIPFPNADFIAISAGERFGLALRDDGSVAAWGGNYYGQCDVSLPNENFIAISAGYGHCLGLKSDGSIVAWGKDTYGQCRIQAENTGFIDVSAGGEYSLGLKSDGSIIAWGRNNRSQCDVPSPNIGFVAMSAGYQHSLGLKADGAVMGWGDNYFDQRIPPSPNTGFIGISAGFTHSLGLRSDSSIEAWGFMMQQKPPYNRLRKLPPINMGFLAIDAGSSFNLGLKDLSGVLLVQKFLAKAGKSDNQDQVQFSGLMDAMQADILGASEIVVSIDANDIPDPNKTFWTSPIDDESFKNGKYNYARTVNASKQMFKFDPRNGKVLFKAKNEDLTGLSCPMTVTVTIGDYTAQIELDEDIVNGSKKPCPPQFLVGVRDYLEVSKVKVKDSLTPDTDSLSAKGWFAMAAEPGDINSMTIDFGGQMFTIPGPFVYKWSDDMVSMAQCKKVDTGSGLATVKFDMVKCTFSLTLTNAELETVSGPVDLGVTIDMDTGIFNQTVTIDLL